MGTVEALIHGEVGERSARSRPRRPTPTPAVAEPARPRGFFCASSEATPSASICTRDKTDCTRAREAAAAVVADLGECALVESARCFEVEAGEERCAPTADGCASQRERAGVEDDCNDVR